MHLDEGWRPTLSELGVPDDVIQQILRHGRTDDSEILSKDATPGGIEGDEEAVEKAWRCKRKLTTDK